ncbi:hypothetical protein GH714_001392 [Hevea brasiliensis]|uniref:ATPase family AAA domain-containing protein n=1 Tax=Hevea brasiliensis TaxID=3981 RepID=A0A6A6M9U1_HEVBR|nr:hypothetical protein GH714_001392 [Hevea brasiliensis]
MEWRVLWSFKFKKKRMGKTYAIGLISALAASASISQTNSIAFANGPFNFSTLFPSSSLSSNASSVSPPFPSAGQSPPSNSAQSAVVNAADSVPKAIRNDNPTTTSAGFDPEALERGAKALREIASSSHAKKVFEVTKTQEATRQAELAAKNAEFKAMQAQSETKRQRVIYDEQKKLAQHQAQTKSQKARYEDELAKKECRNADDEYQRSRNQELVKLQEESSIRQEQARRATEEQIQAQQRQTEREKAEIECETITVRAMAKAEGRAHEAKLAEDVNKRMLIDRANAEREKWVAAINTTFDHIGGIDSIPNQYPITYAGGLQAILTDQNKLLVTVVGCSCSWDLCHKVMLNPLSEYFDSCSGLFTCTMSTLSHSANKGSSFKNGNGFGDVILHPSLHKRLEQLSNATANTKSHQASFRNLLFYGPPRTGAARELASKSGLDYALMTGGDVATLGSQAVTKIHQLFDWAKKSKRVVEDGVRLISGWFQNLAISYRESKGVTMLIME